MSAKKTDISQIRKYLNGELDAHAMHQLEREAQDDPFLMDALEGFENATADQQPHLTDLDDRLQQRIDQSKIRRLIPWKYYAAAAAILIVFTFGYLFWTNTHQVTENKILAAKVIAPPLADHVIVNADTVIQTPGKQSLIATNTPPPVASAMAPSAPRAQLKAAVIMPPNANAAMRVDEPVNASDAKVVVKADTVQYAAAPYKARKTDSNSLKEVTIVGYGAQAKRQVTNSVASIPSQQLQGKLPDAQVTTPNHISGVVMDQMGIPLPGVSVLAKGTQNGTQTDAAGRFSIAAKEQETLDISFIGYTHKQIQAKANDQLKVMLNEDQKSLSEVVVVGYGKPVKPDKNAHPITGWDNYNRYLKRKAIADDGKAGNVKLSFTVDEKGQLSDFKILNGLSDATNKQAIDMVKDGPAWAPDASGKAKTVKLKIHFSKE